MSRRKATVHRPSDRRRYVTTTFSDGTTSTRINTAAEISNMAQQDDKDITRCLPGQKLSQNGAAVQWLEDPEMNQKMLDALNHFQDCVDREDQYRVENGMDKLKNDADLLDDPKALAAEMTKREQYRDLAVEKEIARDGVDEAMLEWAEQGVSTSGLATFQGSDVFPLAERPMDEQDRFSTDEIMKIAGTFERADGSLGKSRDATKAQNRALIAQDKLHHNQFRWGEDDGENPSLTLHKAMKPALLAKLQEDTQDKGEIMEVHKGILGLDENESVRPDGVRVDKDGNPVSLVYTASTMMHGDKWWSDDNPPGRYEVKAQYDMFATGVGKAEIIVNAGGLVKSYTLDRSDTLSNGMSVKAMHDNVQGLRKLMRMNPPAEKSYDYHAPIPNTPKGIRDAGKNLGPLLNMSPRAVESKIASYKSDNNYSTDEAVRAFIRDNWSDNTLKGRKVRGLDIETASVSPRATSIGVPQHNYILSTGLTCYQDGKRVSDEYEEYGVPKRAMEHNGTGAVDVHQITPDDVKGKTPFAADMDRVAKWGKIMKQDDGFIVAHNSQFEEGHMSFNVPVAHPPIVDTKWFTQHFTRANTNTLEDTRKFFGKPYENAHNALADAQMYVEELYDIVGQKNWWDNPGR